LATLRVLVWIFMATPPRQFVWAKICRSRRFYGNALWLPKSYVVAIAVQMYQQTQLG